MLRWLIETRELLRDRIGTQVGHATVSGHCRGTRPHGARRRRDARAPSIRRGHRIVQWPLPRRVPERALVLRAWRMPRSSSRPGAEDENGESNRRTLSASANGGGVRQRTFRHECLSPHRGAAIADRWAAIFRGDSDMVSLVARTQEEIAQARRSWLSYLSCPIRHPTALSRSARGPNDEPRSNSVCSRSGEGQRKRVRPCTQSRGRQRREALRSSRDASERSVLAARE